MRPYLAIVKDSFREAFHSRVLWVVLAAITVFLLAMALVSYRQTLTVGLREDEVRWPKLIEQLNKAKAGQGTRGAQRFWSLLGTRAQAKVGDFKPLPPAPRFDQLQDHAEVIKPILKGFKSILEQDDLYQSTSFSASTLQLEGKMLLQREKNLSHEERLRLNRLLLEASFGDAIAESEPTSLKFNILGRDLSQDSFPISKPMLLDAIRVALPWLVDKGLLAIGLLIAIIVTAPAIPQMFEPGSLHLLMSKPVSRSLLYLSKFFGSCAFVLLCATYLFIGLYALLGSRWGLWEPRLLWCIPIYTFVFAVYYSVATLAALFWRNVIVSVLVAIVFWAVCFAVGLGHDFMAAALNKARLRKIVPVEDGFLAVDGSNTPLGWNADKKSWNIVLLSKELRQFRTVVSMVGQMPIKGPIYDQKERRAILLQVSMSNGQHLVTSGKAEDGFAFRDGPASPFSPLQLLSEPDGQPLLITGQGFYRLQGDLGVAPDEIKFMGIKIPMTSRGPLREAGPKPPQSFDFPFAATFASDGALFTYSRGKLQRFTRDSEGKYEHDQTEKFESKSERRGWVAASRSALLVGFRDGKLQLRDPATLELRKTLEPTPGESPRVLTSSPDGKWLAALMENRKLYLLADGAEKFELARVSGQGDLSAVRFTKDSRLLVVDYVNRVTEYDTTTWQRTRQVAPPLDLQTAAYRYVINPIYTVCPKPGEFYRTVTYLLTEKAEPTDSGENREAEEHDYEPPARSNPWSPVYSSFAFLCVMLLLGCVYMERSEF